MVLQRQVVLKAADLGHLCDPKEAHKAWVASLEEEFFMQGDAEKAADLPVTPLFDRAKPGVTKSQVAFFDVVAIPLYATLTTSFAGMQPIMEMVSTAQMPCMVLATI
jgi:hypothetical protein